MAIFDQDVSFLNRLIPEIRVMSADGWRTITLLLFTSIQNYYISGKNRLALKQLAQFFNDLDIRIAIIPIKIAGVSPIFQLFLFPYRVFRTFLFLLNTKPEICHVHSIEAGVLVSIFKPIFKYKIIFESHGAVTEEILLRKKYFLRFLSVWFARLEEWITVSMSNRIICVSHALKNYLEKKYHGIRSEAVFILPSGIVQKDYKNYSNYRESLRKSMGLNNRFVIVFSGDFHEWQRAKDVIFWCKQLKKINKNSFFLILSHKTQEKICKEFFRHGFKKTELLIKSVPYFEVPKLLPVGDLGLLPRRRLKVNEVASPLKLSEYLAAGVPVLATPFVDQVDQFIRRNPKAGFLVNSVNPKNWDFKTIPDLNRFVRLIKKDRKKIADLCHISAINNFSWDRSVELLNGIYSDLPFERLRLLEKRF